VGARLVRGALFASCAHIVLACAPVAGRTEPTASPADQPPPRVASSPNRAPRAEAPRPADVERWLSLTRELGDAIVTAGADCTRVASAVTLFTRSHGAAMLNLNAVVLEWESVAGGRASSRLYAEARPHINRRVDAAIRCDTRADARRAFDAYLKASGLDTR